MHELLEEPEELHARFFLGTAHKILRSGVGEGIFLVKTLEGALHRFAPDDVIQVRGKHGAFGISSAKIRTATLEKVCTNGRVFLLVLTHILKESLVAKF